MEPKAPDPITAAENLRKIPARVHAMAEAFRKVNEEAKRFPDWRQYQILMFIKYAGLYAADLNETYRIDRIDSLAQAMRNLMELNVWTQFCAQSEENAKRFFDDAARDLKDMGEALQSLHTDTNKEPDQTLKTMLTDLEASATKFNIDDLAAQYTQVNNAAGKIGIQSGHARLYKAASKFAHPTALLLSINRPLKDLLDSFYEGGSKLVYVALGKTENAIKVKYPNFSY